MSSLGQIVAELRYMGTLSKSMDVVKEGKHATVNYCVAEEDLSLDRFNTIVYGLKDVYGVDIKSHSRRFDGVQENCVTILHK